MGMSAGGSSSGLNNDINVTPMIDVLLVLLIIFMIVVPMSRKVIDIQLPDPTPQQAPPGAVSTQIVLEVAVGGQYSINREVVPKDKLAARLKEIYDPRPDKVIFVKGANEVTYQDVVWAMDQARGAGVKVIGVPPKDPAK
jgi:biopolymer transport protein ExbD